MKNIFYLFYLLLSVTIYGQVDVKGYYRKNGTYVAPHTRTRPNSTVTDNYSYMGNTASSSINDTSPSTNTGHESSDVWVEGYYRSDGTYVKGYYRSVPNQNQRYKSTIRNSTNSYNKTTLVDSDALKNYSGNSNNIYHVTSQTLKLRAGPSSAYPVLKELSRGKEVKFVEKTNSDWTIVIADSQLGYVYSKYISDNKLPDTNKNRTFNSVIMLSHNNMRDYNLFKVNVNSIDVRKNPDWSATIFATLNDGEVVETLGKYDENWTIVRLQYGSNTTYRIGYIPNKYFE